MKRLMQLKTGLGVFLVLIAIGSSSVCAQDNVIWRARVNPDNSSVMQVKVFSRHDQIQNVRFLVSFLNSSGHQIETKRFVFSDWPLSSGITHQKEFEHGVNGASKLQCLAMRYQKAAGHTFGPSSNTYEVPPYWGPWP